MVRASRNVSNLRRAAQVHYPEQIDRVPVGLGADGTPEFATVRTGRARHPKSLEEWRERRVAGLLRFQSMPAVAALIALLEAGEDADVKGVGRPLDDFQRAGVRTALGELADADRERYPPGAALMARLQTAWRRQWPDREVAPPRVREAKCEPRARVVTGADGPPSIEHLAAAWGSPLGSA